MKTTALLFLIVLFATASFAAPAITSVTPTSGPVGGGTTVTIKGSGFSNCGICSPPAPPEVFFGQTRAASVQFVGVDPNTLVAITPVEFAGTVDVVVRQFDGTATLPNAFTFAGATIEAMQRILLPVYTPPVHGAFGSEFRTEALVGNVVDNPVVVYGVDATCLPINPPPQPNEPITLNFDAYLLLPTDCSTWPARFFYVPLSMASSVGFNDRVRDVSRSTLSNGTEIPVVRPDRFSTHIVLLNVPLGGNFRNTLRIYAEKPTLVNVSGGGGVQSVQLQAGADMFDPAYAALPFDPVTSKVTIDSPSPAPGVSPSIPGEPIWAFITSTNNSTQEITTISPN